LLGLAGGHRHAGCGRSYLGIRTMSLINKMLQDLEARSDKAPDAIPASLRPARHGVRRAPLLVLGTAALLVLLGAGIYAWQAPPSSPAGAAARPAGPASRPAPELAARSPDAAPSAEQP